MIKIAEIFEKRQSDITEALLGERGGWFGTGMIWEFFVNKKKEVKNF